MANNSTSAGKKVRIMALPGGGSAMYSQIAKGVKPGDLVIAQVRSKTDKTAYIEKPAQAGAALGSLVTHEYGEVAVHAVVWPKAAKVKTTGDW